MELRLRPTAPWSLPRRILFRFIVIYVVLYGLTHPFGVPLGDLITEYYGGLWNSIVPWFGDLLFGLEITVFPNGSGDTTYNYVQLIALVAIAGIGCALWSVLDRKRRDYDTLLYYFRVFLRYYLAFVMLTYGFVKVIKLQFPFPSIERLIKPYGDSSPMGLLWTFMGYSEPYTFFAGLGEVIGGLLLFFRRTTTLGALIVMGVMSNVVMMNFSYDVPVKLFSSHLLFFGLLLILKDLGRLLNVFILNRTAQPADLATPFSAPWMHTTRYVVKTLVIGYVLYTQIAGGLEARSQYGTTREHPPLYGLYDVDTFVVNGDTLAPMLTDSLRWHKLFIDYNYAGTQMMNDRIQRYAFEADTLAQTLTMWTFADTTNKHVLDYTYPTPDAMTLQGVWDADTLSIHLSPFDLNQFLLVNRGFRWVNEYPFNR